MVVSLGTVLWVANGVGGGGPRLAFFIIAPFLRFGANSGQLLDWPLVWVNLAFGPRFTGYSIMGFSASGCFCGRLFNWHTVQ